MSWLTTLQMLDAAKQPAILISVAQVKGHAPRNAGAKMIVTETQTYGSIGGGNLEASAIEKARALLDAEQTTAFFTVTLSPKGGTFGVQCCGGEVSLLLEKIDPRKETVAIFGAGHLGWALVQVLGLLPIQLMLIDSREQQLEKNSSVPTLQKIYSPVPETTLHDLPTSSHILVMTHDHAEDLAILDAALNRADLGFIGLIGSSAKWTQFQKKLLSQGHSEASLRQITTPIGVPGVPGKSPAAIAIATAAQLLSHLNLPEGQF